ncbi:hypothetical protein NL676_022871 [Syzygium grande]|nr:hypothetical protein NL676_022871 [Syzygium grande]
MELETLARPRPKQWWWVLGQALTDAHGRSGDDERRYESPYKWIGKTAWSAAMSRGRDGQHRVAAGVGCLIDGEGEIIRGEPVACDREIQWYGREQRVMMVEVADVAIRENDKAMVEMDGQAMDGSGGGEEGTFFFCLES